MQRAVMSREHEMANGMHACLGEERHCEASWGRQPASQSCCNTTQYTPHDTSYPCRPGAWVMSNWTICTPALHKQAGCLSLHAWVFMPRCFRASAFLLPVPALPRPSV
jgi:hypothetical protein